MILVNFFANISLFLLLFMGSLGVERVTVLIIGSIYALFLIFYSYYQKRTINYPKYFFVYILFLIIVFIYHFIFPSKIELELTFLSFGLFWLAFYNQAEIFKNNFLILIVSLSVLMVFLNIYSEFLDVHFLNNYSLFAPAVKPILNSHLGDLWAISLIAIVFLVSKKKYRWSIFLIPVGIYFLTFSMSRAAILSFAIGFTFAMVKGEIFKKYPKLLYLIFFGTAVMFFYIGLFKTTIFSRPYFWQSIIGFFQNPLGIGLGNFGVISRNITNTYQIGIFSTFTHNLILEVVNGLGVFSVPFILWFGVIVFYLLKSNFQNKLNLFMATIFFTISINFMFALTYLIPTMVFIWGISLGLSMSKVPKSQQQ